MVKSRCVWSVYRLPDRTLLARAKNVQTNYGLTALAGALQGSYAAAGYNPPNYLLLDTYTGAIQNAGGLAVNATSVTTDKQLHVTGDTGATAQLVLGVGTANQEQVNWTAVSGAGPYTYTISACGKTHAQNDPCCRQSQGADDLAQLQSDIQYDATNAPNQRLQTLGGYSQGTGLWTVQFFLTGNQALGASQANLLLARVGLGDSLTVGQGHMHNAVVLGYTHQVNNDVEIDVDISLING